MKLSQRKKPGETFPQWVSRLFPDMEEEQKDLISQMLKTAWFEGLEFERKHTQILHGK